MTAMLAIDQGTTGTTCLVVHADGRVLGRGYREITQHYPHPGWVEHDPQEIVQRTVEAAQAAMAEALATTGVRPVALGITNQRETVVLWDRATGVPVAPAIVWQDRRTASRCAALQSQASWITERTGLVTDPYFSATKLEWLLNQPGVRARAASGALAAGTIDSWVIWQLTGGRSHVTDHTNASRTMLYDLETQGWSPALCALFDIPMALLPQILPSAGYFGETIAEPLGCVLPILGVAGDQQAALYGQGGWAAGDAKNTYGTGAFLLMNTGTARPAPATGLLTTMACDAAGGPAYAVEASIFVAGAAVQWLRDGLGVLAAADETEALAASLRGNDGVYFVPALTGLGAPDWEPEARGTIVGLTRGTTRAHLARAALEAMAYATADVLAVMRRAGGLSLDRLRVDGGATRNSWLMQFQADLLGVPVERPAMVETTALGAAGLAGRTAGLWRDGDAFLAARRPDRFTPGDGFAAAQQGHQGWRRAVRATLGWARDVAP